MKTTVILETNRSGMYIRRNLHDTFHEISSDFDHLRPFLEFGKILVKNDFEVWQEVSGPQEIIDKFFTEPTIEEQIAAIKKEIETCERTLAGMSLYDGGRSSIVNGELPKLKARLQELLNQKAKPSNLKEEVQTLLNQIDVKINGNTVRKVEVEPEPEPANSIQVVDTKEYEARIAHIERMLQSFKFNSKLRMGWKSGDTCYKRYKREFESALQNSDYEIKMSRLGKIEKEMYCRRIQELSLRVLQRGHITSEEIKEAEVMIQKYER